MPIDREKSLPITDRQYEVAAENLAHEILNNKLVWDENLEYHRMDLLIELESILLDNDDDKIERMRDDQYKYVNEYARYAVEFLSGFFDVYYSYGKD